MAKASVSTAETAEIIKGEVSKGVFAPVYLLMGEEPFYVDMVAHHIEENALEESQRDFNQLIAYGADVSVEDIVSNARRYPMFAERQLVVIREAQMVDRLEGLSVYTENPVDTTVLVLVYRGKVDKRSALYKSVQKNGCVLESNPVRDYEMPAWIQKYFSSRGLAIDYDAAALLAEYVGTDLCKVATETDKMMKNLPSGASQVHIQDIEANVGVSREFSVFELTRQLSYRQADRALRTAAYIGGAARFAMPKATAALFLHFNRILSYEALLMSNPHPDVAEKTKILGNPYFFKEYETAVRNYPYQKCRLAIKLIRDYDFKGKGGNTGEASPGELLVELVTKLLSL